MQHQPYKRQESKQHLHFEMVHGGIPPFCSPIADPKGRGLSSVHSYHLKKPLGVHGLYVEPQSDPFLTDIVLLFAEAQAMHSPLRTLRALDDLEVAEWESPIRSNGFMPDAGNGGGDDMPYYPSASAFQAASLLASLKQSHSLAVTNNHGHDPYLGRDVIFFGALRGHEYEIAAKHLANALGEPVDGDIEDSEGEKQGAPCLLGLDDLGQLLDRESDRERRFWESD